MQAIHIACNHHSFMSWYWYDRFTYMGRGRYHLCFQALRARGTVLTQGVEYRPGRDTVLDMLSPIAHNNQWRCPCSAS